MTRTQWKTSGPCTECLSKKETDTWDRGSASDATKLDMYPENVPRPIWNTNTPPVASSFSTIPNHPPPAYTKAANAYTRIKAIYKELPDDKKNKLADDLKSTGF